MLTSKSEQDPKDKAESELMIFSGIQRLTKASFTFRTREQM